MDVNAFLSHRRSLATPSGEIAYTELGAGPAALFVHGVGTSGALWRQVIAELSDTSRCIAVDLPAHGASPARDDMSPAALAEALADLCDGLGLGQVDLVGNDTGGAIAQIFDARHPDKIRTLTLTNCDCEGNFPPPEFVPVIELARQGALAEDPEPGWAKDLVETVAAGMAGPVFEARVNPGCRTCPVASCCPVHPDGEQVTP